ncbi:hypothetical protein DY000_02013679 [Brassica cretica]|uniref:Uncharacterized protein n=1 Tax=Brassica cretica TaxID=69181 RepID=A0ABQ7CQU2_BRACR|nr:hypothetical protein DY000_02013679 [Brassica cretica]
MSKKGKKVEHFIFDGFLPQGLGNTLLVFSSPPSPTVPFPSQPASSPSPLPHIWIQLQATLICGYDGGDSGRYGGDRLGGSDNRYSGGSDRSSSYGGFGSGGSIVHQVLGDLVQAVHSQVERAALVVLD